MDMDYGPVAYLAMPYGWQLAVYINYFKLFIVPMA